MSLTYVEVQFFKPAVYCLFLCSLLEAMAVSLFVDVTAVSSAKVADVVSGEMGRSTVNNR
jgi:hypothetical protein